MHTNLLNESEAALGSARSDAGESAGGPDEKGATRNRWHRRDATCAGANESLGPEREIDERRFVLFVGLFEKVRR